MSAFLFDIFAEIIAELVMLTVMIAILEAIAGMLLGGALSLVEDGIERLWHRVLGG